MIGTSDGGQYQDWADYHVNDSALSQGQTSPKDQSDEGFVLDQDHHVPLVASALMDKDGAMYGMAIDHRLKLNDDQKGLLALHEGAELPYMNDLVKTGMSAPDAYAEAHKWATARETAASVAKWGQDGHEAYKDGMREAAAIASQPSDRERHPDAHTTRYGLDESELGYPRLAE